MAGSIDQHSLCQIFGQANEELVEKKKEKASAMKGIICMWLLSNQPKRFTTSNSGTATDSKW
jgi:hypothetical protein